ncbi:MAG: N-acetylneuraminate synthase [Bacteroidia bacterium]|nr:N-acetylneuraminate synthase [Bacteroidia bacterium]
MLQFNKKIKIFNKEISENSKVFIIAEAGVNHNGDMRLAKALIDVAVSSNADAVKFQTFHTDDLIIPNVAKAPYQQKTTDSSESQYEMLKKLEVTFEQNLELLDYCKKKGIIFLTTPFDESSLNELDNLNLPAYKISSTDLTNIPFLIKVAKKGKPIILSTGMSYMDEIDIVLQEIFPLNQDVVLLHCTANYPVSDDNANLNVISSFKNRFQILVGYSDHTSGIGAAPFAIPLGAKVIEKHFTLSKELEGPDHNASLTPDELKKFVSIIRNAETYLGRFEKFPTYEELKTRKLLQKSLVAFLDIKKGEFFSETNLTAKRTGGLGISPLYFKSLIGRKANKEYSKDEIIDE